MEVKIRNANRKDVDEILLLLYQLQRPRPKTSSEKIKFARLVSKYLVEKDKKIIVAKDGAIVVGLASIVFLPRLNRSKTELYIPELVVSEGYRGRGVGKSLIDSCIKIAKKKKCFRIRLESGNQRKASHRFYKNIGFEQSALSYTMNL